jgi:DNA-binding response OmpR family regulator
MALPDGSGAVRLVVVDTERGFLHVLARRFEALNWQHRVLAVSPRAEDLVPLRLSAIVVDLTVAGPDPWGWLERTVQALPDLPVVVCSGPSTVAQRVRGLRLGADDWLNKPAHPEELVARVEAAIRRRARAAAPAPAELTVGEVVIRPDQFQAFASGKSLDLTRREFELLHLLADADGRVLPREEIYQRVWGWAMAHGDRSVDVFVRKLRQKLEKVSPEWHYIHTHFGVGYRLAAEPADGAEVAAEALEPPAVAEPPAAPVEDPLEAPALAER